MNMVAIASLSVSIYAIAVKFHRVCSYCDFTHSVFDFTINLKKTPSVQLGMHIANQEN